MTHAELRAEILTGPLADELRPLWGSLVRAGEKAGKPVELIDPDRAFALAAALKRPGTRTRPVPAPMTAAGVAGLLGTAFAAVLAHPRFPDLKAAVGRQDHAAVAEWAGLFNAAGLVPDAECRAVVSYTARTVEAPCSRAEELGWAVSYEDVRHAKREELGWKRRYQRGS